MKLLFNKRRAETPITAQPPQPVVVVSGLPRSGTSMMMKMLAAGGVAPLTDELRAADADNPKGYFEFERVKGLDKGDTAWLPAARGKAVKVISALLKYLPPGECYQVIFIRRHMSEVLSSQRKMLIRRGEDPDRMDEAQLAALFERHIQQIEQWLARQPHVEVLYVHYSDVMAHPLTEINRISRFLGRDLDIDRMAEVVDPALYRNRRSEAAPV